MIATLGSIEPGSLEIGGTPDGHRRARDLHAAADSGDGARAVERGRSTQYARDDGAGNVLQAKSSVASTTPPGRYSSCPTSRSKIPRAPSTGRSALAGRRAWDPDIPPQLRRHQLRGCAVALPERQVRAVLLRATSSAGSTSNHSGHSRSAPFRLVPGIQCPGGDGHGVAVPRGQRSPGATTARARCANLAQRLGHAGSINYLSGAVTLTSWSAGATNSITRASCVTTVGENISSEFVFRTGRLRFARGRCRSSSPARSVNADRVSAGIDGTITASGVQRRGLRHRPRAGAFGTVVTAAAMSHWFDAENVSPTADLPAGAGRGLQPALQRRGLQLSAAGCRCWASTRCACPATGACRSSVRRGFAVVGHTGRITASVSNGQTIDCARVRLSRVRVVGNDGVVIHDGYTTDLEAGTVTFTNVAAAASR